MNYELLKAKMDKFFKETSALDLIKTFEEIGYKFVTSKLHYKSNEIEPVRKMVYHSLKLEKKSFWSFKKLDEKNIQNKNLELFEVFLFTLQYERNQKSLIYF